MAIVLARIPALDDDDGIERLSRANPGWAIEFNEDGSMILSPTFSESGSRELEAAGQLREYAKRVGGKAFGPSAGFRLPGNGLRSPDASWISTEHLKRLHPEQKQKFWTTYPDVVIEVLSETDSWTELKQKIHLYERAGARYALAIDPYGRGTYEVGEAPKGLDLDVDAIIDA